jgi:putative endonuclease
MLRRWLKPPKAGVPAPTTREIGDAAEEHALRFLVSKGLQLHTRNYRGGRGEIDLILRDGTMLVFVEVRYRRDRSFGGGAESVDRKKQAKLQSAAEHFLHTQEAAHRGGCRFDVVAVGVENHQPHIEWIQDAFEAND